MSRSGSYLGGSTVIGPRSNWFSKRKEKKNKGKHQESAGPKRKEKKRGKRSKSINCSSDASSILIKKGDLSAADIVRNWKRKKTRNQGSADQARQPTPQQQKKRKKAHSQSIRNPERAEARRAAIEERMNNIVVIRKPRRKLRAKSAERI